MIELEGIWRSYEMGEETLHALADVHLSIQPGEHMAIMGPSGSGKSTLLNVIGLLDRATAGQYRFDGRDVTALDDPRMAPLVAARECPIALMHMRGTPETMQRDPRYDDVTGEVLEYLRARAAAASAAGVSAEQLIVDPGIGFGKTIAHNLELISGLAAFQGMGLPVMLGASRKRFIGTLSGVDEAGARVHGSVGAALVGAAQGAQILRVHDVAATCQAIDVWSAATGLWEP